MLAPSSRAARLIARRMPTPKRGMYGIVPIRDHHYPPFWKFSNEPLIGGILLQTGLCLEWNVKSYDKRMPPSRQKIGKCAAVFTCKSFREKMFLKLKAIRANKSSMYCSWQHDASVSLVTYHWDFLQKASGCLITGSFSACGCLITGILQTSDEFSGFTYLNRWKTWNPKMNCELYERCEVVFL